MILQAKDIELVARNLAIAREYPDDIVLNYTIKSLARSDYKMVGRDIENELQELRPAGQSSKRESGEESSFRPERTFRFTIDSDESQDKLIKRAKISRVASFWAVYVASGTIRSGKRMAFNFSSLCATLALTGMFVCLLSDVNKALILVINHILLTLAAVSGLVGVLFLFKIRSANLFFDEAATTAEMSAYLLARKTKNVWLIISFFSLLVSFSSFCISAQSGHLSVRGFVVSYGALVLALECALIAALFQLKQGVALEKVKRMTDQMCRPPIYHENAVVVRA
jgi:hypothetical protein